MKWMNEAVFNGHHGEGIKFFALRHLNDDERAVPVQEWTYKNGFDVDQHVDAIIQTSEQDAIGMQKVGVRYVVEAYFGTSKVRGKRFTMTVDGTVPDEGDSYATEGHGPKGEMAQMRRHLENMHRLSIGAATETLRIFRNENESMRNALVERDKQRVMYVEAFEALKDKQHERDEDSKDRSSHRSLRDAAVKQALPLLPIMANRVLGENLLQAPSPKDIMIQNIAKTLIENPEKMQAIVIAFADQPEILAQLNELIKDFRVDEAAQ